MYIKVDKSGEPKMRQCPYPYFFSHYMRLLTAEELLTRQLHEELYGGGTSVKTTSTSQVHVSYVIERFDLFKHAI